MNDERRMTNDERRMTNDQRHRRDAEDAERLELEWRKLAAASSGNNSSMATWSSNRQRRQATQTRGEGDLGRTASTTAVRSGMSYSPGRGRCLQENL